MRPVSAKASIERVKGEKTNSYKLNIEIYHIKYINAYRVLYMKSKYRFPSLIESISMKTFCKLKWLKAKNYLRTHLANGCTKETEIKHRCSQTQFEVMVS